MVIHSIFILLGFILLVKGASVFVDGACAIAKRLNMSDMLIGLTIVAFGTSAPELSVSVVSALKGSSGIAIGNVLGSNVANTCLVLGGAGLIASIPINKRRDLLVCILTSLLLVILLCFNQEKVVISRIEGLILLLCMLAYIIFTLKSDKALPIEVEITKHHPKTLTSVIMVIGGCIALVLGGNMIVEHCVAIAKSLNVSEEVIGLTIVALGTSLPELATSIASVVKGKSDIAFGNVIGSNIMNTCLVLGCAGVIRPIESDKSFVLNGSIALVAAIMLYIFMMTGKKRRLDRIESLMLVVAYISYIIFTVYRR